MPICKCHWNKSATWDAGQRQRRKATTKKCSRTSRNALPPSHPISTPAVCPLCDLAFWPPPLSVNMKYSFSTSFSSNANHHERNRSTTKRAGTKTVLKNGNDTTGAVWTLVSDSSTKSLPSILSQCSPPPPPNLSTQLLYTFLSSRTKSTHHSPSRPPCDFFPTGFLPSIHMIPSAPSSPSMGPPPPPPPPSLSL